MRAELYRPAQPGHVVAVATWDRHGVRLEALDGAPDHVDAILRPTPVLVDDASLRRQGTRGEVLLQPSTLEWFRAALLTRAEPLGLAVRFVPGRIEGGWEPAAQYRSFDEQIERLSSSS